MKNCAMLIRRTVYLIVLLASAKPITGLSEDLDIGKDAVGAARLAASRELGSSIAESTADKIGKCESAGWVRLRGVDLAKMPETRSALARLHEHGLKTCAMLRWPVVNWQRTYLPKDLWDAYQNGRQLGAAYGDLVDAWEVDNEPDLGFVPEAGERYAAFLKAYYLGLKVGAAKALLPMVSHQLSKSHPPSVNSYSVPIVLMGALGLPPGPWLERFAANDGFSYTDGFNYHYYGYAEDFSGVYRQHEAAALELSTFNTQPSTAVTKSLPIFLSEIGYGMLGKSAKDAKEGRLRQWRWFKSVGEQAGSLRIEAPMAFYLPPFFDGPSQSEFGLTMLSIGVAAGNPKHGAMSLKAGDIEYQSEDFNAKTVEPWMKMIGKNIDRNETTPALAQWISLRAKSNAQGSHSQTWEVATAMPSSVVIDFLADRGLSSIKRYSGSFVLGRSLQEVTSGKLQVPSREAKPDNQQPTTTNPTARTEEFMIHVRTANGNLYEVYPTRQATREWQSYSEAQGNFTLSFYGRAELPWRFKDNRPASLVVVLYPKQLPAVYEFRRLQLVRIGQTFNTEVAKMTMRYGHGKVVLYNFSEKPVSGRLVLPKEVITEYTDQAETNNSGSSVLKLLPNERREISVVIRVPWERFEQIAAPISFVPEDQAMPPARFLTSFMPDIEGMQAVTVGELLPQKAETSGKQPITGNRSFIANRSRATEEASMAEQGDFFVQHGATVEKTADGFTVTVTETPPGKQQRVEVEIPWPEGVAFTRNEFLNLQYRLRPITGQ